MWYGEGIFSQEFDTFPEVKMYIGIYIKGSWGKKVEVPLFLISKMVKFCTFHVFSPQKSTVSLIFDDFREEKGAFRLHVGKGHLFPTF